jgi:hypothetical protein
MSMRISRMIVVTVATFGCFLALTGTALADTSATATVGPVTIPHGPISACVSVLGGSPKCVSTPPATAVKLAVTAALATPVVAVTPPTITPIPCPSGTTGAAAAVSTGSALVAITGSVTVTLAGAPPLNVPIAPVVGLPNRTIKIYACTGVS